MLLSHKGKGHLEVNLSFGPGSGLYNMIEQALVKVFPNINPFNHFETSMW